MHQHHRCIRLCSHGGQIQIGTQPQTSLRMLAPASTRGPLPRRLYKYQWKSRHGGIQPQWRGWPGSPGAILPELPSAASPGGWIRRRDQSMSHPRPGNYGLFPAAPPTRSASISCRPAGDGPAEASRPSPEKLSGVRFRIPITQVRSAHVNVRLPIVREVIGLICEGRLAVIILGEGFRSGRLISCFTPSGQAGDSTRLQQRQYR